ncbi:unnamed protein product [Leuciscus chuanchicus]
MGRQEDSGYVVYENRMTSSYEVGIGPLGSITRDSHFELLFQCRYSGTSVEALVVEVNTVPPPPPVAAPGPLRVELRLANGQCVTKGCAEGDEAYTSYYSDADYPVTKVLREPVYVEVHILERTDPNIVLMLGRCWATSTPSPLSLPQWDLLVDGCPYQDDRYLTTLVPVAGSSGLQFPTHYKRFVVKMFTFVDPASLAPLQETIFIHCSTAVCHPSSGSCEQSCTRKRRDTHVKTISSGQTVVSSGQVNLVNKLTSGFKSQFNSNLVNGFLSRSKSQFNSNLVNGFLSRFKSQFKSKLVNGFLSRFKSQFKSKLVNSFLSRFNSKLVNGFLSRFKSRFKSKLVSSFLSRFNSKLVNGFLSRFKSQFNSKLVNSFLRQFNSKPVNSFLSQFNSKLVNSFLSQFNSKLVNSFLSSFSLSSQWHRQIPLTNEDSGYVVYENRMTSSYEVGIGPLGSITRDSHFEAVRSLYDRSRSLVRIAGSKSDFFPVHVGLRQGCPLSPVLFIIFMDRISRRSQRPEGVRFGDNTISSLLFADDVVVLAPSDQDLQHALGRFGAECEAAGMRISTSKSEAMVLSRKKVACLLQVGGEFLPQVEEFKYLGVLFTSEGRMEREIDRRIGAASAVMRSMYRSVVVKKELSRKAKLSIYRSIYVPTLTYGHELWVMTERTRSRIQAAEMSFLRRVAGRSLRDRVRSSVTREELRVEPLLLHIERGQLRWLGHLFRMPPGRLPGKAFRARPTGRRPRGRPRTRWRDYVSRLAWERLGVPPEELEEVSRERGVWASRLRLLPPRPGAG